MEDQLWWPSEAHRQSSCTHEDPGDSWKGQGRGEEALKNVVPRFPCLPSRLPTLLLLSSFPNSCVLYTHTRMQLYARLGVRLGEDRKTAL